MLHALLGIKTVDDLLSLPMMGYSWEGFVLEHISQLAPRGAGAEMDVVVQHGSQTIGFEFKSSSAPKVKQGFHNAMQNLKPMATFIVAQVDKRYAFCEPVVVIALAGIGSALQSYSFARQSSGGQKCTLEWRVRRAGGKVK